MTPEEHIEKLEDDFKKGKRAESILQDPLINECLTAIRGDLFIKFQKTKYDQSSDRDEIWRKMQAVDWFEKTLTSCMNTGKLAKQSITDLMKEKIGF